MSHSPTSLAPFLHKLEARSQLNEVERSAVLALPFAPRHVSANQDFVQQGDAVTHSCFVLEGMVGTFGQSRRGERQITALFLSGDMIDVNTVVVPEALAAIQGLVPSTILQVPHSALRQISVQHPAIAQAFWRESVIYASILNQWVMNVGRRDARSRLAHLFCEIACRTGFRRGEEATSFPFAVTQNQLADMLGLTPVHVNRTLKGLREDGVLDLVHRTVQILDWQRLKEIGDFDADYLRLGTGEPFGCVKPAAPPRQIPQ